MTDPITFRTEVYPSDVEVVHEIASSTGFFTPAEIAIACELVSERLTRGLKSGYHFLFAEQNKEVLGYTCYGPIACTQASFDLYWLVVRAINRGQGLGSRLLTLTEQAIKGLGGKRVYIETSSRPLYAPTRIFYERRGYFKEAVLRDFYAPADGKVIYVKALE